MLDGETHVFAAALAEAKVFRCGARKVFFSSQHVGPHECLSRRRERDLAALAIVRGLLWTMHLTH